MIFEAQKRPFLSLKFLLQNTREFIAPTLTTTLKPHPGREEFPQE